MRKRRTTWRAAASAAGNAATMHELQIWTRQRIVWTDAGRIRSAAVEPTRTREEWTAPVKDSRAA